MNDVTGSFIPKQSGQNQPRRPSQSNFVLFAIISYALFIAAPVASAAVYVYQLYTDRQYAQSVQDLDTAVRSFKLDDMNRVVLFDNRLDAVSAILDARVSVTSVMAALEGSTIAPVTLSELSITRSGLDELVATGEFMTETFDATLFQSEVYDRDQSIDEFVMTAFTYTPEGGEEESSGSDAAAQTDTAITFGGTFSFTEEVTKGAVLDIVESLDASSTLDASTAEVVADPVDDAVVETVTPDTP